MSSTALLTYAHRTVITLLDGAGNPTADTVTLQSTSSSPKKTLTPIDFTNSESGGLAEWAPGVTMEEVDFAGIVDGALGFLNVVYLKAMGSKFLARVQLYFTKPTGANNPAVLTGTVLFTESSLNNEVTSNGSVWKFTGKARVVGAFALTGVDVTKVTGFVQA